MLHCQPEWAASQTRAQGHFMGGRQLQSGQPHCYSCSCFWRHLDPQLLLRLLCFGGSYRAFDCCVSATVVP